MKRALLLATACLLASITFAQKTITFPAKDGLTVTGDLYVIDEAKQYMVLCHQAGWSRGEYRVTAERFNKLGYNCLAIDQRSGNAINEVKNETSKAAKEKGLPTEYLDAEQDIIAAVDYIASLSDRGVILVGSSYSASLALKVAKEHEKVSAVLAFSPGEYFGKKLNLAKAISGLNKPVYATSSKKEGAHVKDVLAGVSDKYKKQYTPGVEGKHGSRALWKTTEGNQEYWLSVISFVNSMKEQNQ